jgi:hypothetical protein
MTMTNETTKSQDGDAVSSLSSSDGLVTIRTKLGSIWSHAWLEPTENGYRGMSRTKEYDHFGNLISDETKPTGLEWVYKKPEPLSIAQRIKNFFH